MCPDTRVGHCVTLSPGLSVHMADMGWTAGRNACDPVVMPVADPMLVVRRHVDLQRVRSAMCRAAR